MKQTAVKWLEEELAGNLKSIILNNDFRMMEKLFEQAKAMEKDEMYNAWNDGYDKGTRDRIEKISNPVGNAEQYYNETFKSE